MTEPWEKRLIRVYGMREGEYAERLAAQGGVCAACGKRPGRTRLVVDHDHTTGAVRGLLHSRCNRSLAPFESSLTALRRAVQYLLHVIATREGKA